MSRWTTLGAVVLALVAGLGSTAQTEDAPIAPWYEDATEAELAFYDTEIPCPPIEGLELADRTVRVDFEASVACRYQLPDSVANQWITVTWLKAGAGYDADRLCFDQGERNESDDSIRDVINNDPNHAVRAEYSIDRATAFEPAIVAAAEQLMAAVTPYARGCAQPPTPLECPEVPGHVLSGGSVEPRDFQVDTYLWGCTYEASSPTGGGDLQIEVWWAAQGGVPELYDRLCNEPPYEGVGFGVLVADGTAANATYWLISPLDGPDRAVAAAAAQDLLDQAALQAPSCDEAENLPTTYTPFPDYLDGQFTEELIAAPAGEAVDEAPDPAETTTGTAPTAATDDGLLQTLLRIGSVVMLIVSILGLFITFLLIRRETRIRERRDMLRIGVTLAVAVASILVLGRHAPLWAVLMGIGLGVALGTWQGSNLLVRSTPGGLVARRSTIAIVAFATGVVVMQVAGILNRTGAVAVGVGASFLAAAITAGLFVGRRPRMAEALGGAARVLLPAAVIVGALAGITAVGTAQEDETPPGTCEHAGLGVLVLDGCEGYENLLDVVPWDDAHISGGLWSSRGKPPASIALPRGLATPPEPVSQSVEWSQTDHNDNPVDYQITETYSFGTLADGACCSVFYEGSGTVTSTQGEEVVVETREVNGRLHDVHPYGTLPLANQPVGVPFSEQLTLLNFPEDSCQRVVARRQVDSEEGAATWDTYLVDGEGRDTADGLDVSIFVDCDLPGFTWEHAFELAPPPPAADSPDRQLRFPAGDRAPEVCPVRQEFAAFMFDAGQFDGVHTHTLAELFLEPNAVQCDYGGLFDPPSFGQGGRGQTRHEIIYRLAILNDPAAEAQRRADDEDTFFGEQRPTSIPPHARCEVGADGVPLPPPEGENCFYASLHSPGAESSDISGIRSVQLGALQAIGGRVSIRTEYVPDGPNVWIRAHLPWGKYVYRCHHCEPGDPRITEFIQSLHEFGSSRGFGAPTEAPADDGTTTTTEATDTTVADPADDEDVEFTPVEEEEGISTEEAALIGLVGLLGSMGILASSLEGTGLTPADIAEAIRRGDLTGGVATATAPPPLLDEDGDPLFVNDGSYPEAPVGHVWWGVDEDEGRWVSREEAEELVAEATAADAALEEDRAEALRRAREQADEDWETLIETSRAEAAEDRLQAAMEREERQTLIEGTAEARDAAAAGGYDDLLDFMERNPILTAEQIEAVHDAINRRAADEAALDAIPEVDVVRETISGSLETAAQLAEAGGRPDIAWILRNPGTTARVGAAVATGAVARRERPNDDERRAVRGAGLGARHRGRVRGRGTARRARSRRGVLLR